MSRVLTMRFDAYYSDGRSAQRERVTVFAGARGLAIQDGEGDPLGEWPYRGLHLLEEVYRNQPVRFRHDEQGDATLTCEDGNILKAIKARSGQGFGPAGLFRASRTTALLAVTGLLAVGALAVLLLPRLAGPLTALVPAAWEEALGDRVVAQIAAARPFCRGEAGMAALERLSARLTAGKELSFPVRIEVSSREGVNAFAVPGGRIVVLRELISKANGPEEVAGVLAHEIAHGLERHPMRGLVRALGLKMVAGALLGDATVIEEAAGRFGQLLLIFAYTREDELAADRLAVALLNRAGMRGDGLLSFFRRLEAANAGAAGLPRLLSTHPLTSERIELIEAMSTGRGDVMTKAEWAALRAICDRQSA